MIGHLTPTCHRARFLDLLPIGRVLQRRDLFSSFASAALELAYWIQGVIGFERANIMLDDAWGSARSKRAITYGMLGS